MSKGGAPYFGLGKIIRDRRELLGVSAKEFWEKNRSIWEFPYSRYAAFERGESLPGLSQLMEIGAALGLSEFESGEWLLAWVSIQAEGPSAQRPRDLVAQIQRAWGEKVSGGDGAKRNELRPQGPSAEYRIDSNSIPVQDFDHTWVLGPRDRDFLEKHPQAFYLLVLMEVVWPGTLSAQDLGLDSERKFNAEILPLCERWIQEGRVLKSVSNQGTSLLRLGTRHFHVPKTDEWMAFRRSIIDQFVTQTLPALTPEALRDRRVFRTFTTRCLDAHQIKQFCEELRQLEKKFFALGPPRDLRECPPQSLLVLLAPAAIRIKK